MSMAVIKRFQDAKSWQVGRKLVNVVYDLTSKHPFRSDRGLVNQIRRSSESVPSNIAEGFCKRTDGELTNALGIARGSAGEVQSQLMSAHDHGYISESEFQLAFDLAGLASKLIESHIRYLEGR